MKLIKAVVILSMLILAQTSFAADNKDDMPYQAISCELGGIVIFMEVPMPNAWDELTMVKEVEKVCESLAAVAILAGDKTEE